jgi:hypothetical protein
MKVIPVFLFGTRGDVLPVVTVIDRYLESLRPALNLWRCVVVTHACFAADLQHIGSDFEVRSVPGPPIDKDEKSSAPDYASDFIRSLGPEDSVVCVLSNMFSLQSVFVAFQTGAMCVLLHPCRPIVRSAVKRDLLAEFEALQPELYRRCVQHTDCRGLQRMDYEHWLWPTLADELTNQPSDAAECCQGQRFLYCVPRVYARRCLLIRAIMCVGPYHVERLAKTLTWTPYLVAPALSLSTPTCILLPWQATPQRLLSGCTTHPIHQLSRYGCVWTLARCCPC